MLGAAAQATQRIALMSSVTVISILDPVRVFEDFATAGPDLERARGNRRGSRFADRWFQPARLFARRL